uniref:hypothetical protein n=1 Tax=Candidatus Enterococcus willemsii TaxID=1857215 RepID=UPI00403EFE3F
MTSTDETIYPAQQTFCAIAINNLNETQHLFAFIRHIDGQQPKGKQAIAEQLIEIEDRLLTVKQQIQALRYLYKEM